MCKIILDIIPTPFRLLKLETNCIVSVQLVGYVGKLQLVNLSKSRVKFRGSLEAEGVYISL